MREILFRGKRVDNGEWVKGGSIINAQDGIWIIPTGGIIQYAADSMKLVYVEAIPVIPETVCEYTGLTDKNGTKIFEGDIVRGKDCIGGRREGSVFYDNYNAMYMIKPNTKSEYREVNCFTSLTPAEAYLEVIGNIHDNPELLKEDEQ